MSSLVTVASVRAQIQTGLNDTDLQDVIDCEEAEVIRRFGAHYSTAGNPAVAATVSETVEGRPAGSRAYRQSLYFRRKLTEITKVVEDGVDLEADDYRLWGGQGRIERLPAGLTWGEVVTVTYIPEDDNGIRRAAIIDLVRIALGRTAMKSESVGGEFSYTAPDWDAARKNILARIDLPTF